MYLKIKAISIQQWMVINSLNGKQKWWNWCVFLIKELKEH